MIRRSVAASSGWRSVVPALIGWPPGRKTAAVAGKRAIRGADCVAAPCIDSGTRKPSRASCSAGRDRLGQALGAVAAQRGVHPGDDAGHADRQVAGERACAARARRTSSPWWPRRPSRGSRARARSRCDCGRAGSRRRRCRTTAAGRRSARTRWRRRRRWRCRRTRARARPTREAAGDSVAITPARGADRRVEARALAGLRRRAARRAAAGAGAGRRRRRMAHPYPAAAQLSPPTTRSARGQGSCERAPRRGRQRSRRPPCSSATSTASCTSASASARRTCSSSSRLPTTNGHSVTTGRSWKHASHAAS